MDNKTIVDSEGKPYRLGDILSSGGMGSVYYAETPDGYKVAVKFMMVNQDWEPFELAHFHRLFNREIKTLQRLKRY